MLDALLSLLIVLAVVGVFVALGYVAVIGVDALVRWMVGTR